MFLTHLLKRLGDGWRCNGSFHTALLVLLFFLLSVLLFLLPVVLLFVGLSHSCNVRKLTTDIYRGVCSLKKKRITTPSEY